MLDGSGAHCECCAQAEEVRAGIAAGVRQLFTEQQGQLFSAFRAQDMGTTEYSGYVSQQVFRQVLDGVGVSIEAACFASPGVWIETRKITDTVDVRTAENRKGPVKETLSWRQDRPCNSGPVEYERWMLSVINPKGECAMEETMATTAADSNRLYDIWTAVTQNKRALLWELHQLDREAIGYVTVADFYRALQVALECSNSDAKLVVKNIPLQGGSGYIDYRRWLAEFTNDPRIDWQSYLNVALLATGTHELRLRNVRTVLFLSWFGTLSVVCLQADEQIRERKLQEAQDEERWAHEMQAHQQGMLRRQALGIPAPKLQF